MTMRSNYSECLWFIVCRTFRTYFTILSSLSQTDTTHRHLITEGSFQQQSSPKLPSGVTWDSQTATHPIRTKEWENERKNKRKNELKSKSLAPPPPVAPEGPSTMKPHPSSRCLPQLAPLPGMLSPLHSWLPSFRFLNQRFKTSERSSLTTRQNLSTCSLTFTWSY